MRLISAKIENFRVHAGDEPVEVVFDDHLHVIHGPNESGKSTLMDAVAACLFQKYNLTGKAFESMQPDDGSKPLVEVVFEDDGHEYTVSKHFKGQSGTCQLIVSQNGRVESTLSGPDAEAKLNEALKLPNAGRGDRKDDQLAHWCLLWINQGHSNDEPTEHINPETRDHLQGILNAETGGAMVSTHEAEWIAALEKQVAERFTSTGKPKAGSPVALLTDDLAAIEAELDGARTKASAVEQDSDRYLANGRTIREIEEQLPTLRTQLGEQQSKQKASDLLQKDLSSTNNKLQQKSRDIEVAKGQTEELSRLQQAIQVRDRKIVASDQTIAKINTQLNDEQETRGLREKERDLAEIRYAQARRAALRAQAHAATLRARLGVEKHQSALDKAATHAAEVKKLAKKIAGLPINDADVEHLQELHTEQTKVEAALAAASAKITMSSPHSITLFQGEKTESLDAGTDHERQIEQEARITIGDGEATVLITPGGEDLQERRERVVSARSNIRDRLLELGVDSLATAKQQLRKRGQLESQLNLAETRVQDVAPDGVESILIKFDAASKTREKSEAELARHSEADDPELSEAIDDADEALCATQTAHVETEQSRDEARQRMQAVDDRLASLKANLNLNVQESEGFQSQNEDDHGQIESLTKSHGDNQALTAMIQTLVSEVTSLEAKRKEVASKLETLQPELITAEIERLGKAVKSAESEIRAIENEQNQLLGRLTASDAVGLNERTGDLTANSESTREELARQSAQAEAMQLLLQTIQDCREDMTRQIMEPLRKKVEPLLRVVFGGAQLDFTVNDDSGSLSLRPLVRNRVQDPFDRLSAGAREQVGVAIRLALAQVLAGQHGGHLPVVLDEPFVNTDPGRLSRVLAMLNLVKKDLQIIVMTCDYGDYRELGLDPEQVTELAPQIRPI